MKIFFILSCVLFWGACSKTEKSVNNHQKFTNKHKNTSSISITSQSEAFLKGVYCFKKVLNKDSTFITIKINNKKEVTGEMFFRGWQTDSMQGTLKGKLKSNNEMNLTYDYITEGIKQSTTMMMKIHLGKLYIKNIQSNGKTSAKYTDSLISINCGQYTQQQ